MKSATSKITSSWEFDISKNKAIDIPVWLCYDSLQSFFFLDSAVAGLLEEVKCPIFKSCFSLPLMRENFSDMAVTDVGVVACRDCSI